MQPSSKPRRPSPRPREQGGATLNFVIILLLLAAGGLFAYKYVPVVYEAEEFKTEMQKAVDGAGAMGRTTEWVTSEIVKAYGTHNIPPDAAMKVEKLSGGGYRVNVKYTRPIEMPGFTYNYEFDKTVTTSGFLVQ
jgi:hypothetical protein